jgi:diguanylate cyclase (GGDEF)-like protein/PAS domain S-box-containing protein
LLEDTSDVKRPNAQSSADFASVGMPGLIEAVPVAIVECDREGRVLVWNRAAERLLGWPAETVVGRACPLFPSADDPSEAALQERVYAGTRVHDHEVAVRRSDGAMVDVSLSSAPVRSARGVVETVAIVAIDVTERRRRARELQHFATHDPLTDLHNRRAFEQSLGRIVERARHGGPSGALLTIDVDRLKEVNDRLGHLAGDALLIAVANVLRGIMRPRDLIARLGGDEFGVALESVTADEAALVAERVRASVAAQRIGPEGAGHSTASVGGIVIDGTIDPPELLAAADDALYIAKRRRDSTEIHPEPRASASANRSHARAAGRLRRALSVDGIAVQYQTVLDLTSRAVHSQEALARVKLGRDFHPAAEFVQLATHSGLIAEIDRRVVALVLDRIHEPGGPALSVNLSSTSFSDERLLELLRSRAPRGGFAGRLIIEAKEPDVHADPARAAEGAAAAVALGVAIAVDDFGTNKHALGALDELPIGLVKLDASIVGSLSTSSTSESVRELANACTDRGISVAAKGIEDVETLQSLARLGVNLGQGFLLDEPHAVIGLTDVLETTEEFGEASLALMAWEFTVPEQDIAPAWRYAIDEGLLEAAGGDARASEALYSLTRKGHSRVRALRTLHDQAGGPTPDHPGNTRRRKQASS